MRRQSCVRRLSWFVAVAAVGASGAIVTPVPGPSGARWGTVAEATSVSDRIFGPDRFATAATVALAAADAAPPPLPGVVIADGRDFPDALAAASLGMPLLLTEANTLPAATRAALQQLVGRTTTAVVVGGPAAVGAAVLDELRALGFDVGRLSGLDRFATAADIARSVAERRGIGSWPGKGRTAFIASGVSPADALAAGPIASAAGIPLLLTRSTALPAPTAAAITELGIQHVVILGGTAAVSAPVSQTLAQLTGSTPTRLGGSNRHETAALVASAALASFDFGGGVLLVNGANDRFPDAMAAGPLGSALGRPVLLVSDSSVPAATRAWLSANAERLDRLTAIGGERAVPPAVLAGALDVVNGGPDPGVSWSITSREPGTGVVRMVVEDRSGRNLTVGSEFPAPTLDLRRIFVRVSPRIDGVGVPILDQPSRVQVFGAYRNGAEPDCGTVSSPLFVTVCVGFPLMDNLAGVDFSDIPNHPVDVSTVLDVLEADPTIAGPVDTSNVHYEGTSMGAISGLMFVAPQSADPRITTMIATVGFAIYWRPGMRIRANWDAGPRILMVNALNDPIIPNEVARNTMVAAGGSSKVEMLVHFSAEHGQGSCTELSQWRTAWFQHHVLAQTPAPPAPTAFASSCWAYGPQPGGSSGFPPLTPAAYQTTPDNWPPPS